MIIIFMQISTSSYAKIGGAHYKDELIPLSSGLREREEEQEETMSTYRRLVIKIEQDEEAMATSWPVIVMDESDQQVEMMTSCPGIVKVEPDDAQSAKPTMRQVTIEEEEEEDQEIRECRRLLESSLVEQLKGKDQLFRRWAIVKSSGADPGFSHFLTRRIRDPRNNFFQIPDPIA
jgi:hypothetical protein